MVNQVGIIIIGAGRAGQRHAMAVRHIKNIQLIGVYDSSTSAAEYFSHQFDCTAFKDLKCALSQEKPCFCVICTPPDTHGYFAIRSIEAGMHTLVEKPFDLDINMIDVVEKMAIKRHLCVGAVAQHRFSRDANKLRMYIRNGDLGKIISANIFVQRYRSSAYFNRDSENWRLKPTKSGGGVLISVGFHYLDLACWIIGTPSQEAITEIDDHDIEMFAVGTFKLCKAICRFDIRWGDFIGLKDKLCINGTLKRSTLIGDHLAEYETKDFIDRYELHARQLNDFAEAILCNRRPAVIPSDIRPSLKLIFDIYKSSMNGR